MGLTSFPPPSHAILSRVFLPKYAYPASAYTIMGNLPLSFSPPPS